MKAERVVIDTSVFISAIIAPTGKSAACVDWVLGHAELIVSDELLAEIASRLTRPKFTRYVSSAGAIRFVEDIAAAAIHVVPLTTVTVCRDPNDDMVLEAAIEGAADAIISNDKDLLVLHPFRGILILGPAEFLVAVAAI